MNQEVYKEIRNEIDCQIEYFERIRELMFQVSPELLRDQLEEVEAAFEFFVHRMIYYFGNEPDEVVESLNLLLERASEWMDVLNEIKTGECKEKLNSYFADVKRLFNDFNSKAENLPKNQDRVGLVLIAKNEARYLPEWIEYHKAVGVTRFFIYDNESTDNTREILQQYIDEGSVVYTWCPGKIRQFPAYIDALDRFRFEVKYMGFIDTDEFLLPLQDKELPDLVEKLFRMDENVGGIVANWRMFGSDGQIKDNGQPVIGTFLHRAENSFWQHAHVKTICDPRKTLYPLSAHHFLYMDGFFAINERGEKIDSPFDHSGERQECNLLQINHYYVKSREYWDKEKMTKGLVACEGNYDYKYFDDNDRNEVEDSRIMKYLAIVKQNLRRRGFLHE